MLFKIAKYGLIVLWTVGKNQQKRVTLDMVNKAPLQLDYGQGNSDRSVQNKYFAGRNVYNVYVNHSNVYGASQSAWGQWLKDSNMCKPVVAGRTFVHVVKQNAYT